MFVPLHDESCHQPRAHFWPVNEAVRLARNSSCNASYREALCAFISNCVSMKLNGSVIAQVVARINSWSRLASTPIKCSDPESSKTLSVLVPLVLDFHPLLWHMQPKKLIQQVAQLYFWELRNCLGSISFVVGWRSHAPRLANLGRIL